MCNSMCSEYFLCSCQRFKVWASSLWLDKVPWGRTLLILSKMSLVWLLWAAVRKQAGCWEGPLRACTLKATGTDGDRGFLKCICFVSGHSDWVQWSQWVLFLGDSSVGWMSLPHSRALDLAQSTWGFLLGIPQKLWGSQARELHQQSTVVFIQLTYLPNLVPNGSFRKQIEGWKLATTKEFAGEKSPPPSDLNIITICT